MTLRAIIFDVDGTLAETEDAHRDAFNAAFDEIGLGWHWDRALYRQLLLVPGGKERIRHYMHLKADGCDDTPRPWTATGTEDGWVRALHRRKTAFYTEAVREGRVGLRPGVRQLLDACRLHDVRIAIATTTSRVNVDELLRGTLGTRGPDVFECIVAGDAVRAKKPAPDAYLSALATLDLPANACLAVEDSAIGLAAARAAGIPTVVTPSTYTCDQQFPGALAVIPSLADTGPACNDAAPAIDLAQLRAWHCSATTTHTGT